MQFEPIDRTKIISFHVYNALNDEANPLPPEQVYAAVKKLIPDCTDAEFKQCLANNLNFWIVSQRKVWLNPLIRGLIKRI